MTTEDLLNYFYRRDTILLDGRKATKLFQPEHLVGVKATRDIRHPQSNELLVKEGRKFTKRRSADGAGGVEQIPIALEEVHRPRRPRTTSRTRRSGEVLLECNEEITDEKLEIFRGRGITRVEVLIPRRHPHRPVAAEHAPPGQDHRPAGGASSRSTGASAPAIRRPRDGDGVLQQSVLQPGALRPLARRPPQAEPQAAARRAPRSGHAAARGHPRGRPLPDRAEERQRPDRRHRPPRQPARPRRRRAGREPVPHRPRAHGARDQGADEPAGHRDADAAGAHQLQAGLGGHQGVLRVLAALAVHGPDEPALRDHAQAPPLGARPRRPHPRAGRIRGARRPPDALRPRLSDRDAGRSEHRSHRLAVDLRARQRVRLRRDAVPARRRTDGSPTRSSTSRRSKRRITSSRRRTRRSTRRATSPPTWSRHASAASSRWCRPSRSSSWTSRRTSWCPSRPR